jgi:hypothetical protein
MVSSHHTVSLSTHGASATVECQTCAAAALDGETLLKLRRSLGLVALTLALAFLFRSCTNMVQTTTPLLARYALHADTQQVGLLSSIFAAAVTLPVVTVNHRVPPWRIEHAVLVSMLLLGATLPLYAAASQFWQVAVLVAASGFASGMMQPFALTAITTYSAPDRRDRNLALFTVALSAGLLVGPLIETGVLRADSDNLAGVFVAFVGIVAPAVAISALLTRRSGGHARGAWSHVGASGRPSPLALRLRALAGNRPYLLGFVGYLTAMARRTRRGCSPSRQAGVHGFSPCFSAAGVEHLFQRQVRYWGALRLDRVHRPSPCRQNGSAGRPPSRQADPLWLGSAPP